LKLKLSQEQTKIEQLKGKVFVVKGEVTKKRREDQEKFHDMESKAFVTKTVKEATAAVEAAEAKASAVIDTTKNGDGERTLAQLEVIKSQADEALKTIENAKAVAARIHDSYEGIKATRKQSLLEARVEITKLKSRAETSQRKLNTATESISKLVRAAIDKARIALRIAVRSSGNVDFDELFKIAGGKDQMSEAQFSKFVDGLPNHGLGKEQIKMMYNEFGPSGLKKLGFAKIIQEFCSCAQSIMVTDSHDIADSKDVRKLEPGELWEVLEGPVEDPETKVSRVRGRAVRDGTMVG
jgi:hypothetical protein